MATELLLCKVNYGWRKAGSAAGFALLESVSGPKEGDLQCSGVQLVEVRRCLETAVHSGPRAIRTSFV